MEPLQGGNSLESMCEEHGGGSTSWGLNSGLWYASGVHLMINWPEDLLAQVRFVSASASSSVSSPKPSFPVVGIECVYSSQRPLTWITGRMSRNRYLPARAASLAALSGSAGVASEYLSTSFSRK